MSFVTNTELQLAFDFVEYTGEHIFLTGKAGTGKTTFLKTLKEKSPKRMVVVAPTGVAAINAGGVTIHSFFQVSFGPQVSFEQAPAEEKRFNREKINIIRTLDLLVIDEISMVRADLLDAIDAVLRRYKDRSRPFGGVQLLMIGDLQQLSPVVKDSEWSLLKSHYDTLFFFGSRALRQTSFVSIELKQVFRQQDNHFISILNKVRENRLDQEALEALNKRFIPNFSPGTDDGYITLCTHNVQAQRINDSKLQELSGKASLFKATIEGLFPEYSFPTENELYLKVNAQVMFVKNDLSQDKLFFNGKIGKITRIESDKIMVQCPTDENEIAVTPLKWDNVRYSIDPETNEIKETIEGSFIQFPLKLAWAITIHKSQGLTFERAIIDAEASFAHGQVYVALSRCKTLDGMVLSTPISNRSIINDCTVNGFINQVAQNQPDEKWLTVSKQHYQQELVADIFRFQRMRYLLQSINKQLQENDSAVTKLLIDQFEKMRKPLQEELVEVGEKFLAQIAHHITQEPDVEKNKPLQERLTKAADYFTGKINELVITPIENSDLDIDNKAVRKQINEAVSKLSNEAKLKLDCLNACKEGFSVKKILHSRAVALIEKNKPKENRKYNELHSTDIPHPELYNLLRAWRNATADELNLPVYMVFSQKALLELVNYLPIDGKSLKQINGMGSKKVSQFGAEIIEIIADYCLENGLTQEQIPLKENPEKKKKSKDLKEPKTDTKQITFDLFKTGMKLADIAKERNLTQMTIETHLAHFIGTGELDISLFVTDNKLSKIRTYFEKAASRSLTPAREALGEDFSYSELKFVLKYMDYINN